VPGRPVPEQLEDRPAFRGSTAAALQEQILAEIRHMGADIFSTSGGEAGYLTDDPDDPSRALIRQILGAVAQYERSMIPLRIRSGRQRKKARGGYAGGGVPLGYRAEGRELVADTDEQALLDRIKELRASGASLRQIADTLTADSYRPKKSRSGTWHPESLRLIVKRLEG
jgi:DNA invertase Pin-like site-specific DNA recombinase